MATLLRLPTGIFYAGGVKANVLFFDKRAAGGRPTGRSALLAGLEAGGGMTRGYAALHILSSPVIRSSGRARLARLT